MPITSNPASVLTDSAGATDEHVVAPRLRSFLPNITLAALRIVAGLMLVQHGVQKHFGLLLPPGMPPMPRPAPFTQMWIAGTLEIAGGLMLALGVFTRPVAFVLSGLMAFAFFLVHAKQGLIPAVNGGELAALYCFVFLMFAGVGGSRYSVDHLIGRRRASRALPVEQEIRANVRNPRPVRESVETNEDIEQQF